MRRERDIDILVEFEGEKSLLDLAALKIELEKVLGGRGYMLIAPSTLYYERRSSPNRG